MRLVAKRSPEPGAWRVCWSACLASRPTRSWSSVVAVGFPPGFAAGWIGGESGPSPAPAKITALEAEAEPSSRVGIWVVTPGAQLEPPTTLTPLRISEAPHHFDISIVIFVMLRPKSELLLVADFVV